MIPHLCFLPLRVEEMNSPMAYTFIISCQQRFFWGLAGLYADGNNLFSHNKERIESDNMIVLSGFTSRSTVANAMQPMEYEVKYE